jgi:hypothetical protein
LRRFIPAEGDPDGMQLDAIRKTQLRSAGKPPHIFNCLGDLTVIIGVVRESKPGETRGWRRLRRR